MSEQGKSIVSTKGLLIVVIVILLGVVGYFAVSDKGILNKDNSDGKKTEEQAKDGFQAVFLTNGQVYFGKLQDDGKEYLKLTDIYYLQAKDQAVQPKEKADNSDQSNLTLIKLGKELHAPADEMNISKEQVLFWENITKDGKVMKAIEEYKATNK